MVKIRIECNAKIGDAELKFDKDITLEDSSSPDEELEALEDLAKVWTDVAHGFKKELEAQKEKLKITAEEIKHV